MGSGPSVQSRLDKLRSWPEIWAINGAYDYLVSEGIVPHGFVGIDPLPGLAEYVLNVRNETTCYLSATCDPAVFDALEGKQVKIWFPDQENHDAFPVGATLVRGGTHAITRAPYLAYNLGYRDITLFGADASFDGGRYCYVDGTYEEDSKRDIQAVSVDGKTVFFTEINLLKQCSQMNIIVEQFMGMLKVDCDGLMRAYLDAPMNRIDDEGYLRDESNNRICAPKESFQPEQAIPA